MSDRTVATSQLNTRLTELDAERLVVKRQLDRDRLTKATASVVETITSPEFIERMRSFRERAATGVVTYEDVGEMLSLDTLRAAGADFPEDFRLTSRTFEDLESGLKIEIKPPWETYGGGIPEVAWGACAGGGAATVCGCAGGST